MVTDGLRPQELHTGAAEIRVVWWEQNWKTLTRTERG